MSEPASVERHERHEWSLYRLWTAAGCLLYVGISRKVERRIQSHRAKFWGPMVKRVEVAGPFTHADAMRQEANAIYDGRPLFNTWGRGYIAPAGIEMATALWESVDPAAWVVVSAKWTPTETVAVELEHLILGNHGSTHLADSLQAGIGQAVVSATRAGTETVAFMLEQTRSAA